MDTALLQHANENAQAMSSMHAAQGIPYPYLAITYLR